jgi:hypothetical protein
MDVTAQAPMSAYPVSVIPICVFPTAQLWAQAISSQDVRALEIASANQECATLLPTLASPIAMPLKLWDPILMAASVLRTLTVPRQTACQDSADLAAM